MLSNDHEYQKMFDAETQLWWYKILHEKILNILNQNFSEKTINILDAGCGTGGLQLFLIKNGYKNIEGFDYSEAAVALCKSRNLNVHQADITSLSEKSIEKFDVIICNDVMYQFDNESITKILNDLSSRLKKGGLLISNNQAFNIFSGIHDIAVGSKQRFNIKTLQNLIKKSQLDLKIISYNYWSFLLSPLILTARIFQKIQIKLGVIDLKNVKSDVSLPPNFLNHLFYKTVKLEERLIKNSPFGSSILVIAKKCSDL